MATLGSAVMSILLVGLAIYFVYCIIVGHTQKILSRFIKLIIAVVLISVLISIL